MSVLCDSDIKERLKIGDLVIKPLEPYQIGASSIDFRLGNKFRVFQPSSKTYIDPLDHKDNEDYTTLIEIKDKEPFVIHPGEFVLGSTLEFIKIPYDLIGILHGRSSIGRLGIQVHATAGFVEPGYFGVLTLEMSNIARIPVALYPRMKICQLILQKLRNPSEKPVDKDKNAKYTGQDGPTTSKIYKDFELNKQLK
jgi:dCTP deaminase